MISRTSRFWVVGLVLILGSMASITASKFILRETPSVPDLLFHGTVFMSGLALLDLERAKTIISALKFWRRNGNGKEPTSGTE